MPSNEISSTYTICTTSSLLMMNGNVKQKVQLEISNVLFNSFFAEIGGLAMVGCF